MLRFIFEEHKDGVYSGYCCTVSARSLGEALDMLGDGKDGYTYELLKIEIDEEE